MAEYAAHLATNVIEKPSIFEVLAQENLTDGLRNAARYLVSFLTDHYPDKFAFVAPHIEEWIAAADFLVQLYHLQSYHSSFSERYYGLKRIPLSGPFRAGHVVKSLFSIVALPYLQVKVDAAFREARNSQSPTKYSRLLVKVYPYLYFGMEGLNFGYALLYAIDKSRVHSLSLALASVQLAASVDSDAGKLNGSSWAWRTVRTVMDGVSTCLITGAFFLQFLDWWYTQRQQEWPVPVPGPPAKKRIDVADGTCPLCYKEISNDTVLSASGFVFCYACIHAFVSEKGCCPVTGYPASPEQLVRIFAN